MNETKSENSQAKVRAKESGRFRAVRSIILPDILARLYTFVGIIKIRAIRLR